MAEPQLKIKKQTNKKLEITTKKYLLMQFNQIQLMDLLHFLVERVMRK